MYNNFKLSIFLAYFHTLISALCLSVASVIATTSHGVGRSRSFVARSIAYDPRTLTTKDFFIFFGPVLAPRGGPEILFLLYFFGGQKWAWPKRSVVNKERGQKWASVSRVSQPRTLSAAYPFSRVPFQPRILSAAYPFSRVPSQPRTLSV